MGDDANEITGVTHYAGHFKDDPRWRAFTEVTFSDGGTLCVSDCGPFACEAAAQVCVDMATAEGVEEISPELVRRSRAAYLRGVLK